MTKQIHPGEPSFVEILIPDKIDIIHALNFYSQHAGESDVREWAKAWCQQRGLDLRLRGRTQGELISLAAFYRMQERGMAIDEKLANRIDDGFRALHIVSEPREVEVVKPKAVTVNKPIECLSKLDAYLDAVTTGEISSARVPNFCDTKKEVSIIAEACTRRAKRLEEDKEGYAKDVYKALKGAYAAILKSLSVAADKIATEKTKAQMKSKPASVIARDVKHMKVFGKIRSQPPEKMVGARKAYVYDSADRKLILYVSTEAGFTFTGTTLKNIDMAKSFKKIIRNPDAFFDGLDISLSQLNKTYGNINAKEQAVVGRFSDDHVILCIGGA